MTEEERAAYIKEVKREAQRRNARRREKKARESNKFFEDPKKVKQRTCLDCKKEFKSFGPHNRICNSCKCKEQHKYYTGITFLEEQKPPSNPN